MKVLKIKEAAWEMRLYVLGILCLFFSSNIFASFSVEGHYQGKTIYVQNPADEDGFGFCINKVVLNGDIIPVDIYASAFQIDLSEYNIEIGQSVLIVFEHGYGCHPKLLNPEALRPKSTFELQEVSCTPEGNLNWSTTGETGALNFLIEQYKWNKWIVVGEVIGEGTASLNSYAFNILPHSGTNTIRLAQIDNTSEKRVTKQISFESSSVNEPSINVLKAEKKIEFLVNGKPNKTKYEIFDAYGNIVKKGFNSSVNYSNLKTGIYHVNYDNKNERVIVK